MQFIVVAGQVLIVQVGGAAFQVVPIGWRDWIVAIILGAMSLPVAVLIRLLPPGPFERLMYRYNLYPDPNAPPPPTSSESGSEEEKEEWGEGESITCPIIQWHGDINISSSHLNRNHKSDQETERIRRDSRWRPNWSKATYVACIQESNSPNEGARYSSFFSM